MRKGSFKLCSVLFLILLLVCGCAKGSADKKAGDTGMAETPETPEEEGIGEYVIDYDIPEDFDYSKMDGDFDVSPLNTFSLDSRPNYFFNYVIEIPENGYYACCISTIDSTCGVYEFNPDTLKLGEQISNIPEELCGMGKNLDDPNQIFLFSQENLYSYDLKTGDYKKVLAFSEFYFQGNAVRGILGENNNIYVKLEEPDGFEYFMLCPRDPETVVSRNDSADNKTITIGTVIACEALKKAVKDYNKNAASEYKVELIEYDKQALDYEDAKEKLFISMTSMDSPDIVEMSSISDYLTQMVKKGYLSDLSLFIEESEEINFDDYYDKAMELYSSQGKQYAIPYAYEIISIAVNSDDIQGEGWTVSEMMEYSLKYPDAALYYLNNKEYVFDICIGANYDYFVDKASGTCNFDCDEFREILEFANGFPGEFVNVVKGSTYKEMLDSKKLLTKYVYCDRMDEIFMTNYSFDWKANYVGYPTMDGGECATWIRNSPNTATLAICESSDNKEAAWDFIEYYLGTDPYRFNQYSPIYGIPTDNNKLKAIIDWYTDEENNQAYRIMDGPFGKEYKVLSEKELDIFYHLREIAKPSPYYSNREIAKIVGEEADAYFAGGKGIDEVINVIQSRVSLYLAENT